MAEVFASKNLLDSDVGLSSGDQNITVTSTAQKLNLAESPQSDVEIVNVGELGLDYNAETNECTLLHRGSVPASNLVLDPVYNGYTLVKIAQNAFAGDSILTSITIPASVREIGSGAFEKCPNLTEVIFEDINDTYDENLVIGISAFYECPIEQINIPSRVTQIKAAAFMDCQACTSLTFSGNSRLTDIGSSGTFAGLAITTVTLPEGLLTLGDYAFQQCTKLETVSLPETLQTIGSLVFTYCYELARIRIPSTVTMLRPDAFYNSGIWDYTWGDRYTWFVSKERTVNPSSMKLIHPSYLTDKSAKSETYLRNREATGGYADYYWHKLKQMPKPTISIAGTILSMTDPLGVAEAFHVYVNGDRRATVYPSASGSAASSGSAATYLDEGE